jgi:sugar (pentulose or hexulose) kinase
VCSVSCSSWAQDFGLIDQERNLFYPPVSYRDSRTADMPASFADLISPADLVQRVGCGATPVTALCQLRAMALQEPDALHRASRLLFVADLVHWMLCGSQCTDWTMATASQLRNLRSGQWDRELMALLGVRSHFLPEIVAGPRILGRIGSDNDIHPKLAGVPVVMTAGHDTAIAAAAVNPLVKGTFFLSLGTWAMLGCCTGELLVPADPAAGGWVILGLAGGEWGVFRAGPGLWLIQECRRLWEQRGLSLSHDRLVADAQQAAIRSTIDPSDPRFHAPDDMLLEITIACRQAGVEVPCSPGEFAKVIFDSLARYYAAGVRQLEKATQLQARCLHVLGGGSRNAYLCGRIAQESGVSIDAGPAEATAIGNLLLQARTLGLIEDGVVIGR